MLKPTTPDSTRPEPTKHEPYVLYRTQIRHARAGSVAHRFDYRSYWWLVDVDRMDELPRGLRFAPSDYCGDPEGSIAGNVRAALTENGIDPAGLTIRMLTSSRKYGYSFNPVTLFYCQRADGELAAVIAEVHNTYGQRHQYVLTPDGDGLSPVDKQFYVSPFYDVSGTYRIHAPMPTNDLELRISLHRDDEPPFVATVHGVAVEPSRHELLGVATLGSAAMTSLRIRRQGIALWRKGLTIQSRPEMEGAHRG